MNNLDFKAHFMNACEAIGIQDCQNRVFLVRPVAEEGKHYSSIDDIMRLLFLPKERACTFERVLKLFTWKEGYYPLWIRISRDGERVVLRTSLRLRKAGANDDHRFYPFSRENE